MPVTRDALERTLADVNKGLRPGQETRVVAHAPDRFTLSFFDLPMPDGQCVDQSFTEVQFVLLEREKVTASLIGARYDEAERRYLVDYEVVEW